MMASNGASKDGQWMKKESNRVSLSLVVKHELQSTNTLSSRKVVNCPYACSQILSKGEGDRSSVEAEARDSLIMVRSEVDLIFSLMELSFEYVSMLCSRY